MVANFEAFTVRSVSQAGTYFAPVGAYVCFSARLDVAERQVASQTIDIAIRWPQFKQITLSALTSIKTSEPRLRPRVFPVEAVALFLVVAAFAAIRCCELLRSFPAVATVDVGNHC